MGISGIQWREPLGTFLTGATIRTISLPGKGGKSCGNVARNNCLFQNLYSISYVLSK